MDVGVGRDRAGRQLQCQVDGVALVQIGLLPEEHPVRLDVQVGALSEVPGRAEFAVYDAHFVGRADQRCADRGDIGIDYAQPAEDLGARRITDGVVDRVGEGGLAWFRVDGELIVRDRRGAGAVGVDIGDLEDAFDVRADLEPQRQRHLELAAGRHDHLLDDLEHTQRAEFQIGGDVHTIGLGLSVGKRSGRNHSRGCENQRCGPSSGAPRKVSMAAYSRQVAILRQRLSAIMR